MDRHPFFDVAPIEIIINLPKLLSLVRCIIYAGSLFLSFIVCKYVENGGQEESDEFV
jgi:hypothetical protein